MSTSPVVRKKRQQFSPKQKIENTSSYAVSPTRKQRPFSAANIRSYIVKESADSINFGSDIYKTELEPEYKRIDEVIELANKKLPLDRSY